MLTMIAIQMLLGLVGMGVQVIFYATAAYWIAKMVHKGWKDGK